MLAVSVFSGSGAFAVDPTPIETQDDLQNISSNLAGNYVLTASLAVTGLNPITNVNSDPFTGTLDGAGYTISNLTKPLFNSLSGATVTDLNLSGNVSFTYSCCGGEFHSDEVGMLARVASNAVIDSLVLEGSVTGQDYVGGAVGWVTGGSITNTHANVTVIGDDQVGGIAGRAIDVDLINSSAEGAVSGTGEHAGGLAGKSNGDIINSYSSSPVNASSYVGGLVGETSGNISNSFVNAREEIAGTGDYVGGLAGYSTGSITDSYVSMEGSVTGNNYVGGLAGYSSGVERTYADVNIVGNNSVGGLVGDARVLVDNSYAIGSVTGNENVGGLVGDQYGLISNSYATGSVTGEIKVGGLVGWSDEITNSYATGLVTGENQVGGLVGLSGGDVSNSYATGNVNGGQSVGGLVGEINSNSDVIESYSNGNVTGSVANTGSFAGYHFGRVFRSYSSGTTTGVGPETGGFIGNDNSGASYVEDSCEGSLVGIDFICNETDGLTIDSHFVYDEIGTQSAVGNLGAAFENDDECLNSGNPYLVELINSYVSSCSGGDSGENVTTRRVRERELRETKELIPALKIEKAIGFKNGSSLLNNAAISFVEATEKIDITKVKSVEITPTANVKVNTKAGEVLQISLKSESKEPVELWVKSPDGTWLFAGVITFDKDGKAILPPLQFKSSGDFTVVLNKPSVDSAKGSAPLNQTGSLLVVVS